MGTRSEIIPFANDDPNIDAAPVANPVLQLLDLIPLLIPVNNPSDEVKYGLSMLILFTK